MPRRSVYVAAGPQVRVKPDGDAAGRPDPFGVLAKQALSDRQTRLADVERALRQAAGDPGDAGGDADGEAGEAEGSAATVRTLKAQGYLRDGKKWLTNRGFEAVGNAILREIMRDADPRDAGGHRTGLAGGGEWVLDSTRRPEPGDDVTHMSVQETLLNAAARGAPLRVLPGDIEEYETDADTRAAIAYCIDLSSTMKTKTNGTSRIKAAKKALWGLYAANTKHFSRDSVHVIGFASMAARIDPRDIPYLRTFDATDFLHYTNYQAALRLARNTLAAEPVRNKKIVLITDGQPSACYVENERQRGAILAGKPYANFYAPRGNTVEDVARERGMTLDTSPDRQVYLCYRYKKVDAQVHHRTLVEGRRCRLEGMEIEIVVISDEEELIEYAGSLARELGGGAFRVRDDMGVLVTSYMGRTRG